MTINYENSSKAAASLTESEQEIEKAKKSLLRLQAELGPFHLDVATKQDLLAELLMKQGRFSEAEPLLRSSLEIHEQEYGTYHTDVV